MSFLTTQPEELAAAAGKLQTIGATMDAENVAAAVPTTGVIPAAADEVSMLQASLFTAYGSLYQQISAEATAMYDMLVNTLGVSAGTYAAAEAANSSAAASPLSDILGALAPSQTPGWISDLANIFNIGTGNWASAASDLLALASGAILPAAAETAEADAADVLGGAALAPAAAAEAALGEAPIAAGLGAVSSIGAAAPPTWAGTATLVSSTSVGTLQGAGWTAAAPLAAPGTVIPGMPGLASATRSSAGFGAPRYGVKPIVMPKPEAV
ncbi:PE family protein [Mycobacterium kansasii]|uniref:Putative PE family protein PE23 n=1 Tax=Mycobacterium attenuatum TaxID=2341086 RepID=A0A498PYV5_9MYCO|nr:PE domain-containing protein [Mycobacterium attenuatum]ORB86468.1 PE family protein [Mycobacterium kansasii]VBA37443.1 putative PE family protein PE23 [Mycobacterium attenuatum]VBA50493.1 putative PE family protein PE23 [Mycobacterium attenuatum]VBA56259.1 putative PE family protein PE23 [Mycobacterium attenuatum]